MVFAHHPGKSLIPTFRDKASSSPWDSKSKFIRSIIPDSACINFQHRPLMHLSSERERDACKNPPIDRSRCVMRMCYVCDKFFKHFCCSISFYPNMKSNNICTEKSLQPLKRQTQKYLPNKREKRN